jgi:hypothetical protein
MIAEQMISQTQVKVKVGTLVQRMASDDKVRVYEWAAGDRELVEGVGQIDGVQFAPEIFGWYLIVLEG